MEEQDDTEFQGAVTFTIVTPPNRNDMVPKYIEIRGVELTVEGLIPA